MRFFLVLIFLLISCNGEKGPSGSPYSQSNVGDPAPSTDPVESEPTPTPPVFTPDPEENEANKKLKTIEELRLQLENKHFKFDKNWNLDIEELFNYRLDLRKKKKSLNFNEIEPIFNELRSNIKDLIKEYNRFIESDDLIKFESFVQQTQSPYLDKIKFQTNTFYDFCDLDRLNPPEIFETLKVMWKASRNPRNTCDDLESIFMNQKKIILEFDYHFVDLSPLKGFHHLKELIVGRYTRYRESKPLDLSFLVYFKNLEGLEISSFNLSDINLISKLSKLKKLKLSSNEIKNINHLRKLKDLEIINLSSNLIEDASSLGTLPKLKYINLSFNKLIDLNFISGLDQIEELDVLGNNLTDLEPLRELVNLSSLNVGYNQITDLSPLSSMSKLEDLYISNNNIKKDPAFCPIDSNSEKLNSFCSRYIGRRN